MLLRFHSANFDASRFFCSKVIEEKPLGQQNVYDHCAQTFRKEEAET